MEPYCEVKGHPLLVREQQFGVSVLVCPVCREDSPVCGDSPAPCNHEPAHANPPVHTTQEA